MLMLLLAWAPKVVGEDVLAGNTCKKSLGRGCSIEGPLMIKSGGR